MSDASPLLSGPLAECIDLPALAQLGQALWRTEGPRGAAVLIGAGFSRNARLASADMPLPPLWGDLAAIMARELYPVNPKAAPWDPLRLAEEYRNYFGQAALDALVLDQIRDAAWHPSANHIALLALPWSDLLTTNYDTLLERAARQADRAHDTVRSEPEIAFAKAPRIIKLHGSIDKSDHFIIAEEDFRTYPARHAAFVNLARQCFVENELLLLGFSGDDPNFLAWSGWVRDHLGSSARRIFLAGALNLSPAKRKYLEARNIAPIDVHRAVQHLPQAEQHAEATRLILEALTAMHPTPPHAWYPSSDKSEDGTETDAVEALKARIAHWRAARLSYPGWLVCPRGPRLAIRNGTEVPSFKLLRQVDPVIAAEAVGEWCWRHQTALWPLHPQQAALMLEIAPPGTAPYPDESMRLLAAQALLEHARDVEDAGLLASMKQVIEARAPAGTDARAALRYQEAVQTVLDLDFAGGVALAEEVVGDDPGWALRRAGVLANAGLVERAQALILETLADLRDRERTDRNSLWVRSRLAWASFLHRGHEQSQWRRTDWPDRFRESKCDPIQELEAMGRSITEARRKSSEKHSNAVPNFQPGTYQLPSRTIHFGTSRVEPCDELARLLAAGGVPVQLPTVTFYKEERIEALELCFAPSLSWYLRLIGTGVKAKDAVFERYFARIAVAGLPGELTGALVKRLRIARDHWLSALQNGTPDERNVAENRLILVVEILARLAVRLPDDAAIALHLETLAHWKIPQVQRFAFGDAFGRLLANSYASVSLPARAALVLPGLELPFNEDRHLPDPLDWLDKVPIASQGQALRGLVARLLTAAGGGQERRAALSRLAYLYIRGVLTQGEARRFAKTAWAVLDSGDPPLPGGTTVYPHFWTRLPRVDHDARAAAGARVFDITKGSLDPNRFQTMLFAARSGQLPPSEAQARMAFDALAALRPAPVDPNDITAAFDRGLRGYDSEEEAYTAGLVLTWGLAPHLARKDRTTARLAALEGFIAQPHGHSAMGGIVSFLPRFPKASERLETLIRRGLMAQESRQVAGAADALRLWFSNAADPAMPPMPEQLVEQLIGVIELRQAPALWDLLRLATTLVGAGALSGVQRERLEGALGDLLLETDYSRIPPLSELAGNVSLARKQAVLLAANLGAAGSKGDAIEAWRIIGETDPLPEVRHAAEEEGD